MSTFACLNGLKICGGEIKNGKMLNKKLAEELQKPNLNNFKKRKARSSFIDKILDF